MKRMVKLLALALALIGIGSSFHSVGAVAESTDGKSTLEAMQTMVQDSPQHGDREAERAKVLALYGENKKITDGNYDEALAVKCVNGTFVGKKTNDIIAYKGIPFVGQQPVGEYRWKAPVDVVPDDGVYEAYYNAKSPLQLEDNSEVASLYVQGEDCLYLDVWKAEDAGAEKKPVMVWIHGGGFAMGGTVDPMYDMHNFVQENPEIIGVSIEYRLGIFGYMHLSHLPDGADYPDAQNLGLLDQVMALKWVHENIAAFGGDPDNVTIFGESAGGASVTVLPLVKGAQQYFRRVIAQSGAPHFTRSTEESIALSNEIMEALGCKTVEELQKQDVKTLLQASLLGGLRVSPERDGNCLPLEIYEAYANGEAKDIDILQGCNKDEMNYFAYLMGPENFHTWADNRRSWRINGLPEADKALIDSYYEDVAGEDWEKDCLLFSQLWFNAPPIRLADEQTRGGGKSYTYYFTPEAAFPVLKCGHATELASVFKHPENFIMTGRAFDETFSKTMRKMWVQFAKTGDPSLSADISPDGKEKVWPLYDLENRYVMVLDEFNIHSEKEADIGIVDWERIYPLTKYYYL